MKILTIIERADSRVSTITVVARNARQGLSPEAENALERWLSYNWSSGGLSMDFKNNQTGVFREIYDAAQPIRDQLERMYGDKVLLYRGMKSVPTDVPADTNRLYSWTFDKGVAEEYAYKSRTPEVTPLTPHQIDELVRRYDEVGYIKHRGYYYKRDAKDPDYYNIYDGAKSHVTTGDDIRDELESREQDLKDSLQDRIESGSVAEKEIPVSDIVWYEPNAEKEVVVMRHFD